MFPNGWPGRGLLLLRASLGLMILHQSVSQFPGPAVVSSVLLAASCIAGLLLLLGIWTPLTALCLTAIALVRLFFGMDEPFTGFLSAAVALSIAMLGPGVWSIDAVLFGRQRLRFPEE